MPILGSIIKSAIEFRSKIPIEKQDQDPYKSQLKTLRKLLRKAQVTSFGEAYGFQEILRHRDPIHFFQRQVPLFDYSTINKKWWYRTLNGEAYVCWPGQVKYFALSSGTSEASSKYIPVTPDMLKAIKKTSIMQLLTLSKYDLSKEFYEKGILMLGGSTELKLTDTYEGDLSGHYSREPAFLVSVFIKFRQSHIKGT